MSFTPVSTLAELDALDPAEILEGYMSAERDDPEPGPNRGKAFWHGWRNRMIDLGKLPSDAASRALASAFLARMRVERTRRTRHGKI